MGLDCTRNGASQVESIVVCAMGEHFGSFEKEHPFITTLSRYVEIITAEIFPLVMLGVAPNGSLMHRLKPTIMAEFKACEDLMIQTVDDLIRHRRSGESQSASQCPDLLDMMLNGVDEKTGKTLPDTVIRYNIMYVRTCLSQHASKHAFTSQPPLSILTGAETYAQVCA